MNALDRLARAVAANAAPEDATRMTRRDVVRRGGLAVLSLGALAQLGFPRVALSAQRPCPSLRKCLDDSAQAGKAAFFACTDRNHANIYKEFSDLECRLWDGPDAARAVQKKCFTNCKNPPKAPTPGPRTPPKGSTTKSHTPPPLPPNPYGEESGACLNCMSVGGKCCFGGPGLISPGGICACANPDVDCRVYGC